MGLQVVHTYDEQLSLISNTRRPRFRVNARPDEPAVNSILLKREWEALDSAVVRSYRIRLNAVGDLRGAGLTSNTTLAEMASMWRVGSERARPDVTMDGRTRVTRDRTDRKTHSVPLPIIATEYEINMRELMASRAAGADLDTYEAEEAAQAIAEEQERILFDGNSDIIVQGDQIYGYTNHPDRLSDTASNFGGGDFGTLGNGYATFLGAVRQMAGNRYYGPFMVYMHNTQYHELLEYQDDGTGDLQLDRILRLPQIQGVKINDVVSAGEVVMVQMDRNVVDLRIAMELENREWDAPDGSATFYKVMVAQVPRLKPDYRGNLGVCHITSA
jgi:uncharacterized linocin/CFP29 family protein